MPYQGAGSAIGQPGPSSMCGASEALAYSYSRDLNRDVQGIFAFCGPEPKVSFRTHGWRAGVTFDRHVGEERLGVLRSPRDPKINMSAWLFCMSWCAELEFRLTR